MFIGITLLFVINGPNFVRSHCWGIGENPGFLHGPELLQLTPWRVRVSWDRVVTKRYCSDHFIVRYWKTDSPGDIRSSQQVGQQVDYVDVGVTPEVEYKFKVIAREIKKVLGVQFDTDDNHSAVTRFQTHYDPGMMILNIINTHIIG